MAGAECRMGREARAEFGESLAPVEADGFTMGVSIEWYCEDWNTPCTFPDSLDWGLRLDEYTVEPVHRANWYWEVGMRDDQVADAEKIRDYGMYVAYSTFSYCKNRYSKKEDWTCTHLVWVSHVSGKRESRRVVGDYILREHPRRVDIFISADDSDRVRRICTRTGCTAEEARTRMERGDAQRADYYNYYSSKTWGAASTYHLCINSSIFGDEGTADFILEFASRKLDMKF